jgi:TetR/AcrR family transcriptional repressor of nem operon
MSPRTNLKERIIHEALRLFSLHGYINTSVDEILSAAKASKGGMYNHFRSKDELFLAVLEEARAIWRARVLKGVKEPLRHMDRLDRLLDNYRNKYLKDNNNIPGGCIFVSLSTELDDQHPEFAALIHQGFEGVKRILKQILKSAQDAGELKEGIEADQVGEMIFSSMVGIAVLYSMDKSNDTLDRVLNPLIDYLSSLRK